MPLLSDSYTVVAPDMRGCGDSDRPETGYDKQTIATDICALIEQMDLGPARVAGHDWGGAVGYLLAAANPHLVSHFAAIETVLPGFGLAELADVRHGAQDAWWMSFAAAADMPEMLVAGREREFLSYFYSQHSYDPTAINDADLAEYTRCYTAPGAMRAGFHYYRTLIDDEAAFQSLPEPTCQITSIAGRQRLGDLVAASVRQAAPRSDSAVIERCGHYPAEEQPAELAALLVEFFGRPSAAEEPS
jgi:pimeloyl-ACP methyl ester carboxylesterase